MIAVEYLLCPLQVEVILGIFAPRQTDEGLKIAELHIEIGRLHLEAIQLLNLLVEGVLHLFRPFLTPSFFQQGSLLRRRTRANLSLQILNLLLQEIVLLLLIQVLTRLVADIGL